MLDLINLFRHAVISVGKEPKIIFERLIAATQITEAPAVTLLTGHIDYHGSCSADAAQKLNNELVKKFGIHSWVHNGSSSVGVEENDDAYSIIFIDIRLERLVEHVYINSDYGMRTDFLGNRIHISITTATSKTPWKYALETMLTSVLDSKQLENLTFKVDKKST
jgi:hypothetical protein